MRKKRSNLLVAVVKRLRAHGDQWPVIAEHVSRLAGETVRESTCRAWHSEAPPAGAVPRATPAPVDPKALRDDLIAELESGAALPDRANALRLAIAAAEHPDLARWLAYPGMADVAEALMNTVFADVLALVNAPGPIATLAIDVTEAGGCFGCERHRGRAIDLLEAAVAQLRTRPLGDHRPDACEAHNRARRPTRDRRSKA